jgi:hypothetical protein
VLRSSDFGVQDISNLVVGILSSLAESGTEITDLHKLSHVAILMCFGPCTRLIVVSVEYR